MGPLSLPSLVAVCLRNPATIEPFLIHVITLGKDAEIVLYNRSIVLASISSIVLMQEDPWLCIISDKL